MLAFLFLLNVGIHLQLTYLWPPISFIISILNFMKGSLLYYKEFGKNSNDKTKAISKIETFADGLLRFIMVLEEIAYVSLNVFSLAI